MYRLLVRALSVTVLVAAALGLSVSSAFAVGGAVQMEWLGWSHFRFTSLDGKVILVNPFVQNPDSPIKLDDIQAADLVVAADGHGDEIGSTVEIAQKTGARTFTPFELGTWLLDQGVPQTQVIRSNPGGRLKLGNVTVRMVGSVHGSGLPKVSERATYGGPAAGFVITFENGWTVYFAGSTGATQDQALVGEMYRPDLAILPLNGDRDPIDFATQVRLVRSGNWNLRAVMPHHHRVAQTGTQTTIAEAQQAIKDLNLGIGLTAPRIGTVYNFAK